MPDVATQRWLQRVKAHQPWTPSAGRSALSNMWLKGPCPRSWHRPASSKPIAAHRVHRGAIALVHGTTFKLERELARQALPMPLLFTAGAAEVKLCMALLQMPLSTAHTALPTTNADMMRCMTLCALSDALIWQAALHALPVVIVITALPLIACLRHTCLHANSYCSIIHSSNAAERALSDGTTTGTDQPPPAAPPRGG